MSLWDNLLPKRTNESTPEKATIRATGGNYGAGTGAIGNNDIDRALSHYERVLWVFRSVDSIATKLSALPIKFKQGSLDENAPEATDYDLDRILNRKANGYETGKLFRYRLYSLGLLSPLGIFVEIVKSAAGGNAELHILPPGRVKPIPHPENYVAGYEVFNGEDGVDYLLPEQVLWIKLKPHPTDPYRQMTPLMAAGLAADTDYLARVFNRTFLMNDGRPGMLITIKDLQPDDADTLKHRFSGGGSNAGVTSIIEGEGIDIADMSTSPRDAMWTEALDISQRDIMAAFGVPMIALGSSDEKTFDNADAESVSYWTETLVPIGTTISGALDYITAGGIDDDIFIYHDTSKIYALQQVVREQAQDRQAEFSLGLRTANEYFESLGREPVDHPGARVLWMQPGMIPIGAPADVAALLKMQQDMAAALQPPAQGPMPVGPSTATVRQLPTRTADTGRSLRQIAATQQTQGNSLRQLTAGSKSVEAARPRKPSRFPKRPGAHKSLNANGDTDAESDRGQALRVVIAQYEAKQIGPDDPGFWLEVRAAGIAESWITRQVATASSRLYGPKARKGTRHWEMASEEKAAPTRTLDANYIVNRERWVTDLTQSLQGVVEDAVTKEVNKMLGDYGIANDPNIDVSQVVSTVIERVTREAMNQTDATATLVSEAEQRGESLANIKKNLESGGQRRDWVQAFAKEVAGSAVQNARAAVADRIGGMRKTWVTTGDDKVRPSHRRLNGRTIQVSNSFTVGGVKIRFPHDPLAPIGEVANCRCTVIYQ